MAFHKISNIEELANAIGGAAKANTDIGIVIEMPAFKSPEIIFNPPENLQKKLEYYENTYDENLNHKHAEGIKIIGYTF